MIIDGKNQILGRLASFVAKKALLGETVDIINCEHITITGKKETTLQRYQQKRSMGSPFKGPFLSRMPDRFVRRVIRGMIPYKQHKGIEAFKRIMCHTGVPQEFEGKKTEKIKGIDVSKLPNLKYITVGTVCRHLGGKS